MENPAEEITTVIHLLVQSPPLQQHETIEKYFTRSAEFIHPLCRTWRWENSRFLIHAIYRWYKVMSPRIDIIVKSIAFDETNLILYVSMSQVFRIWLLPLYRAPVSLVTVLGLEHSPADNKYYIKSQNDLYQQEQWVRFIPFTPGLSLLVVLLHYVGTIMSLFMALLLWPVSVVEELRPSQGENEGRENGKRNHRELEGKKGRRSGKKKELTNGIGPKTVRIVGT